MTDWCLENFGPVRQERWHVRYVSHFPTEMWFWFHNEKDAMTFSLKWL